jgi:hypothetical protein
LQNQVEQKATISHHRAVYFCKDELPEVSNFSALPPASAVRSTAGEPVLRDSAEPSTIDMIPECDAIIASLAMKSHKSGQTIRRSRYGDHAICEY